VRLPQRVWLGLWKVVPRTLRKYVHKTLPKRLSPVLKPMTGRNCTGGKPRAGKKNHQPPKHNFGWTQTPIGLQHQSLASCSQDGRAIYHVHQPGMKDHKTYCLFSIGSLYSSANQWGGEQCREPSGGPLQVLEI
jgi:hypothetical protein